MQLLVALAVLFAFIVSLVVVGLLLLYLWSLAITRVPFIGIPREVIPDILKALKLTPNATLYDLGCGDGRVLTAAAKEQCGIKGIGMDKSPIAIWEARRAARRAGVIDHLSLYRGNFFDADFKDATHVFCYLYPPVMKDFEPIFERKLKPGTRLVSVDFALPYRVPIESIELDRPGKLGEKLFVYMY